jgi:molybdopterin-binding protein
MPIRATGPDGSRVLVEGSEVIGAFVFVGVAVAVGTGVMTGTITPAVGAGLGLEVGPGVDAGVGATTELTVARHVTNEPPPFAELLH